MREKFPEQSSDQESSWSDVPPPGEKVHQVKLPESASRQEFFSTGAGTVVGRDNLERLGARADGMLADKEKNVANIEGVIQETIQKIRQELALKNGMRETNLEIFAADPSGFNEEFQTNEKESFEKSVREMETSIEALSELAQKLENGTLSREDADRIIEYLPQNEERITAHMFLTRLSDQEQKQREKNENPARETQKLSAGDLRWATDQELNLLREALDRAGNDGEKQKYSKKIDFYSNVSGEIDRFSVWQKDHPDADWDDYLASEYSRRYKLAKEPATDLIKKSREKDLKLIQDVSRDFGSSVVEMKNEIRSTEIGGQASSRDSRQSPKQVKAESAPKSSRGEKIKGIFRNYTEQTKNYRPDQSNSLNTAIEGLKIAYPNEDDRISRLNSLVDAYNKKLEEQLKLYPSTGDDRRASNKTMQYIVNSVLIAPERNAFKDAIEREKQRKRNNKEGLTVEFVTPTEASLEDLFGAINAEDKNN